MKNLSGTLKIHLLPIAATVLFLLSSCATVPITERRTVHLVSDQELTPLSLQEYNKVLQQSRLSHDSAKVQMVRTVGGRIAKATEELLREQGLAEDIPNYGFCSAWPFYCFPRIGYSQTAWVSSILPRGSPRTKRRSFSIGDNNR